MHHTMAWSVGVTTEQLVVMAATLANKGVNPRTNLRVVSAKHTAHVLAMMHMTGFYGESGEWAINESGEWDTSLPSKTGLSGAILAVVPGNMALAAFSPRLTAAGNSVRGTKALQHLANRLGLSLYNGA